MTQPFAELPQTVLPTEIILLPEAQPSASPASTQRGRVVSGTSRTRARPGASPGARTGEGLRGGQRASLRQNPRTAPRRLKKGRRDGGAVSMEETF